MGKELEILTLTAIGLASSVGLPIIGIYCLYKGSKFVDKMASDKASANYINENPLSKDYGKKGQ